MTHRKIVILLAAVIALLVIDVPHIYADQPDHVINLCPGEPPSGQGVAALPRQRVGRGLVVWKVKWSVFRRNEESGLPTRRQALPVASEHLRLMQRCGFLSSEKEGRKAFYKITEPHLVNIMQCVGARLDK